jgi:fructose-bisphosphate aldolase class 1
VYIHVCARLCMCMYACLYVHVYARVRSCHVFSTSFRSKMLIDLLKEQGIIPGIKVDKVHHIALIFKKKIKANLYYSVTLKGVQPMPFTDGETVTEGLDGLAER